MFELGAVVATPAALEALTLAGVDPAELLARHVIGDWGDLGAEDKRLNSRELREGTRIFSAYDTPAGRLWVITEADRSATTLLLPSEY